MNKMKVKTANDNVANRELRITKMLNAPVELVWEVWTNPEHIANWWGPNGFTSTIHTMDVSEGGEWRLTMHGPDGKNYPNKSIFVEIVQRKKIVFQHFNPDYIATIVDCTVHYHGFVGFAACLSGRTGCSDCS